MQEKRPRRLAVVESGKGGALGCMTRIAQLRLEIDEDVAFCRTEENLDEAEKLRRQLQRQKQVQKLL